MTKQCAQCGQEFEPIKPARILCYKQICFDLYYGIVGGRATRSPGQVNLTPRPPRRVRPIGRPAKKKKPVFDQSALGQLNKLRYSIGRKPLNRIPTHFSSGEKHLRKARLRSPV